jgi:hypothetical protein
VQGYTPEAAERGQLSIGAGVPCPAQAPPGYSDLATHPRYGFSGEIKDLWIEARTAGIPRLETRRAAVLPHGTFPAETSGEEFGGESGDARLALPRPGKADSL